MVAKSTVTTGTTEEEVLPYEITFRINPMDGTAEFYARSKRFLVVDSVVTATTTSNRPEDIAVDLSKSSVYQEALYAGNGPSGANLSTVTVEDVIDYIKTMFDDYYLDANP